MRFAENYADEGGECQEPWADEDRHHRVLNGLQPACVEVCPSQARTFGDQEDPKSQLAMHLAKEMSHRLQEEKVTKPNVHYVGKYGVRA